MVKASFLIWKPAFFCKVKEIKPLSGGVVLYAAQSKEQSDAEIVKKGGFRTETSQGEGRGVPGLVLTSNRECPRPVADPPTLQLLYAKSD